MSRRASIVIRLAIAIGAWLAYDWFALNGRGIIGGTAIFVTLFAAYLVWDEYAHRNPDVS
jgi:hypothetical protein